MATRWGFVVRHTWSWLFPAELRSSDPYINPNIELGYFAGEGEADLVTLREGIKLSRHIAAQSPLAKYITEERYPGARSSSDADLDDFIRSTTCSGNALVGTCR